MSELQQEVVRMKSDIEKIRVQKRERLRNLDLFILDNSIRESTVGQLRSHTIENKKNIFKQIKRCGINNIIVASFAHLARVDDAFSQWLVDEKEDFSKFFSFSEVSEGLRDGAYDTETVPISLRKNKKYGLYNTVFEFDLANPDCAWETKFTVNDMCKLINKWMDWVYTNINPKARILINFRDLPTAMTKFPERVLKVVKYLANMPPKTRMFALAFEDPFGEYLPEELEAWTASMRRVMDANGWRAGKLLVHIHQKWDLQTASQLDCLSAGADGVWASLCDEGAAMGHASSSITLMNLVRLGNKKVLEAYDCTEVRKAAIEVTRLTTGVKPHNKQVLYGERALDLVFGFLGIGKFDLAKFFDQPTVNRITSLATPDMIKNRLVNLFGENPQFTTDMGSKMKLQILEDLHAGRKEEYMSRVGIAVLFDRSGGSLTKEMAQEIANVKVNDINHKKILDEIRSEWDAWNRWEEEKLGDSNDALLFDSFYHGFMATYIGCYRCEDTKKAFRALDMDSDGMIEWNEFMVYIKWALNEYPRVETADEVLQIAFEKGIIPAMRDEKLKNPQNHCGTRFND